MPESILKAQYCSYLPLLQAQNKSLSHPQHHSPQMRHLIQKGQLIGQKYIEIMLIQLCFISKKRTLSEASAKIAVSRIYPLIEEKMRIDKKLLKRVVYKLYSERKYEELEGIKVEIEKWVDEIVEEKRVVPVLEEVKKGRKTPTIMNNKASKEMVDNELNASIFVSNGGNSKDAFNSLLNNSLLNTSYNNKSFQKPSTILNTSLNKIVKTPQEPLQSNSCQIQDPSQQLNGSTVFNSLNVSFSTTRDQTLISRDNSSEKLPLPKQTIPDTLLNQIVTYLQKQVKYMKTELTEFCHQFKIKEPVYKRIEEGNSKAFVCKCTVTITDEESKFAKLEYSEKGEGLNTKNSTGEAAKKVLLAIYKDNVALWRKFREIKIKKKIVT